MKEQFHARVSGETPRDYRGLGPEFRGVHGKLKLTPSDATGKEAYLLALIKAMIGEDGDLLANPNGMPKFTQDFIRCLPSLSLDFTNPKALEQKAEFAKYVSDRAAPQDDPVYVTLHGQARTPSLTLTLILKTLCLTLFLSLLLTVHFENIVRL